MVTRALHKSSSPTRSSTILTRTGRGPESSNKSIENRSKKRSQTSSNWGTSKGLKDRKADWDLRGWGSGKIWRGRWVFEILCRISLQIGVISEGKVPGRADRGGLVVVRWIPWVDPVGKMMSLRPSLPDPDRSTQEKFSKASGSTKNSTSRDPRPCNKGIWKRNIYNISGNQGWLRVKTKRLMKILSPILHPHRLWSIFLWSRSLPLSHGHDVVRELYGYAFDLYEVPPIQPKHPIYLLIRDPTDLAPMGFHILGHELLDIYAFQWAAIIILPDLGPPHETLLLQVLLIQEVLMESAHDALGPDEGRFICLQELHHETCRAAIDLGSRLVEVEEAIWLGDFPGWWPSVSSTYHIANSISIPKGHHLLLAEHALIQKVEVWIELPFHILDITRIGMRVDRTGRFLRPTYWVSGLFHIILRFLTPFITFFILLLRLRNFIFFAGIFSFWCWFCVNLFGIGNILYIFLIDFVRFQDIQHPILLDHLIDHVWK